LASLIELIVGVRLTSHRFFNDTRLPNSVGIVPVSLLLFNRLSKQCQHDFAFCLLCSICRASLSLPHSQFSAVNLPMPDGIDVNWLLSKLLSIKHCQCAICIWLCSICRASLLLPQAQSARSTCQCRTEWTSACCCPRTYE